jgi:hypothetical protein
MRAIARADRARWNETGKLWMFEAALMQRDVDQPRILKRLRASRTIPIKLNEVSVRANRVRPAHVQHERERIHFVDSLGQPPLGLVIARERFNPLGDPPR